MPRKKSYLTVTDQFCGAGGSSQGVRRLARRIGGGLEVKLALNHWKLAIETHNTNFPDTLHDCTDISACDPRRYPSTDILITSPECTNHSLAKGVKIAQKQMDLFNAGKIDPAAERSRATMWDVCRFAEYHSYNCIIVENVVDARKWVMFDAWIHAMHALGYNHRCVYLNSMHCHPTPQSRDRMYAVFWKKGNKAPNLDYKPVAACRKCNKNVHAVQTWKDKQKQYGKYRQQYVYCCPSCSSVVEPYYYAAFNCIDWSDIGTRIGDRTKPLSENTIKRIEYGLKKYGREPYILHAAYGKEARGVVKSVTDPAFTQTTLSSQAVVQPFLIDDKQSTGINFRVRGTRETVNTVHTDPRVKLVLPFTIQTVNGGEDQHRSKSALDASFTHTTLQSQGIVTPFLTLNEHTSATPQVKRVCEPMQTQATWQSMGFVTPFMVNHHHSSKTNDLQKAAPTQTTHDKYGLLTPPVITEMRGQGKARPAMRELNGVTAGGIHSGVVTSEAWNSFIASYYNGSQCTKHISEEIGSVTTNDRHQVISYQEPKIEDCYYRMLKPTEIKLAMAFDGDYIVLGSGKDQVKQLGNAVTPPAMEWLVEQCIKSLS